MKKYPVLKINSRSHLASILWKWICLKTDEYKEIIKKSNKFFDHYWMDNKKESDIKKNKICRFAKKWTPLKKILSDINKNILTPLDSKLPDYIYWWKKWNSIHDAIKWLINKFKKRYIIKLDIKWFYDSISENDIYELFKDKFKCWNEFSKFISKITCTKQWLKWEQNWKSSLIRWFSTSSRLSIWSKLDFFTETNKLLNKKFNKIKNNPKMSCWIDDIWISISNTNQEEIEILIKEIEIIANKYWLELKKEKKKIYKYNDKKEFLWLNIFQKTIWLTDKKKDKFEEIKKIWNKYKKIWIKSFCNQIKKINWFK